jgi:hypothetical protein
VSPKASTDESESAGKKSRSSMSTDQLRGQLARVIRLVFGILATILAVGAILVVLRDSVNEQNSIVRFVLDVADAVAGPFDRQDGIFNFSGDNADAKNALVNWGIAAVVYLVVGRVLSGIVAPKGARS